MSLGMPKGTWPGLQLLLRRLRVSAWFSQTCCALDAPRHLEWAKITKLQNQDYSSRISDQMHMYNVPIYTPLQVMENNNIQEIRDRIHLLTDMLMFGQIFS